MTEVIATEACKQLQFETSVAIQSLPPKRPNGCLIRDAPLPLRAWREIITWLTRRGRPEIAFARV